MQGAQNVRGGDLVDRFVAERGVVADPDSTGAQTGPASAFPAHAGDGGNLGQLPVTWHLLRRR